jgi:hypothetical protein
VLLVRASSPRNIFAIIEGFWWMQPPTIRRVGLQFGDSIYCLTYLRVGSICNSAGWFMTWRLLRVACKFRLAVGTIDLRKLHRLLHGTESVLSQAEKGKSSQAEQSRRTGHCFSVSVTLCYMKIKFREFLPCAHARLPGRPVALADWCTSMTASTAAWKLPTSIKLQLLRLCDNTWWPAHNYFNYLFRLEN